MEEESHLRKLRTEIGITREAIVRVSDISLGTIKNAERGRRRPTQRTVEALVSALNHWISQKDLERPLVTLNDLAYLRRKA